MHTIADTRTGETSEFTYDALDRVTRGWSTLFDESYSYSEIGNRTKTGESRTYPTSPAVRPHAPTVVAGEGYSYDDNGNLTGAEDRGYEYDVENRLIRVLENSVEIRGFAYDGDGALRWPSQSGTAQTRYVAPDYQVDIPTGEATVYYSFGGRTVAWHDDSVLRYLLTDHLGSTHGEASDSAQDVAQRRYYPFGSDRPVSGASDLTRDERYTGQKRIDTGNGEARRELYHYGARWYLPGVGVFTQPDLAAPGSDRPQDLNRYAYVRGNPLTLSDSSGRRPTYGAEEPTTTPPQAPPPGRGVTSAPAAPPPPSASPKFDAAPLVSQWRAYQPGWQLVGALPHPLTPWQLPDTGQGQIRLPSMTEILHAQPRRGLFGTPGIRPLDALGLIGGLTSGGISRPDGRGDIVFENVRGPLGEYMKNTVGGRNVAWSFGHVVLNTMSFDPTTPDGAKWFAHEDAHLLQSELWGPLIVPWWLFGSATLEAQANDYRDEYWQEYMEGQP